MQSATRALAELPEIFSGKRWEARDVSSGPTGIRRIQFRRVCGQVLGGDPSVEALEKFANQPAPMRGQSIPDDQ